MFIKKLQLRFKKLGYNVHTAHMPINMTVNEEKFFPAMIIEVYKSASPSYITLRASCYSRSNGSIGSVSFLILFICIDFGGANLQVFVNGAEFLLHLLVLLI